MQFTHYHETAARPYVRSATHWETLRWRAPVLCWKYGFFKRELGAKRYNFGCCVTSQGQAPRCGQVSQWGGGFAAGRGRLFYQNRSLFSVHPFLEIIVASSPRLRWHFGGEWGGWGEGMLALSERFNRKTLLSPCPSTFPPLLYSLFLLLSFSLPLSIRDVLSHVRHLVTHDRMSRNKAEEGAEGLVCRSWSVHLDVDF
jgi:hypothetical protein